MRDDLVVPGEHEEDFVLARDAKVRKTLSDGRPGKIKGKARSGRF